MNLSKLRTMDKKLRLSLILLIVGSQRVCSQFSPPLALINNANDKLYINSNYSKGEMSGVITEMSSVNDLNSNYSNGEMHSTSTTEMSSVNVETTLVTKHKIPIYLSISDSSTSPVPALDNSIHSKEGTQLENFTENDENYERTEVVSSGDERNTDVETENPRFFELAQGKIVSSDENSKNSSFEKLSNEDAVKINSIRRGDTDPYDFTESGTKANLKDRSKGMAKGGLMDERENISVITSSLSVGIHQPLSVYSSMSWLDVFMLNNRDTLWVLFNTIFMVVWIFVGILSLYRLLGLPFCSPYLSRTQYLVVHLLIFTASTFEFVQLIHLSFGSHRGLPLFLTLLLTHTPTPCVAVSLNLMVYNILVSARVPALGSYIPPMVYVNVLLSFIIMFSFVGDIIVGVSKNGIILATIRTFLMMMCLFGLLCFFIKYKKIIGVAMRMRREFRGDLGSLSIPADSLENTQDSKTQLKKVLLGWARVTFFGSLFAVIMSVCSLILSFFFTLSFVPLWTFWVVHSLLFVSQIVVIFTLTFGATLTLSYSSKRSICYKYFLPSFPNKSASDGSFIKRGNFIYQRVSVSNGPTLSAVGTPTILEDDENGAVRNNLTELPVLPCRPKVNLKRSATFNCTPPYGFHVSQTVSSNLYPVLSDHILPYSHSQLFSEHSRQDANVFYSEPYHKPTVQLSSSFHHMPSRDYTQAKYGRRYPMRSFHGDRFVDFSSITDEANQKSLILQPSSTQPNIPLNSFGMAGTVEALEVAYQPLIIAPPRTTSDYHLRNNPQNRSFVGSDRFRYRPEPPEKPARKTEPILVKGVIKDNAYLENAIPVTDSLQDRGLSLYNKNPNIYSPERNFKSREQNNATVDSCISSVPRNNRPSSRISSPINLHTYDVASPVFNDYTSNTSKDLTPNLNISSEVKTFNEKSIATDRENSSPTTSVTNPEVCSGDSITDSEISSTGASKISDTKLKPLDTIVTGDVSVQEDRERGESVMDEPKQYDSGESFNSPVASHSNKKSFLKRNHSAAGDIPRRGSGPPNNCESSSKDAVHELKNSWYGTWGGRRRSKKKRMDAIENEPGQALRKLSASKTSLLSIYEKLKPKRSKSLYHQGSTEPQVSDTETEFGQNGAADNCLPTEVEEEEEEEELLPRLSEDIDLASEILRSSTVLADFYSLDRSYLKKRKEAKLRDKTSGNEETENYATNEAKSVEAIDSPLEINVSNM